MVFDKAIHKTNDTALFTFHLQGDRQCRDAMNLVYAV